MPGIGIHIGVGSTQAPQAGASFDPAAWLAAHTVAYWTFDEIGAADSAVDATGRGNDLDGISDPPPNVDVGKLGNARVFDDSSLTFLSRASTPDLQIGVGDFVVAAWVKVANLPDSVQIVWKSGEYAFVVGSGGELRFVSGGGGINSSVGTVPLNEWKLCIGYVSFAQNSIAVRVDDGPLFSDLLTTPATPNIADFFVGVEDGEFYFDGLIDDTLIAKTQASITVSGAGTETVNGVYVADGAFDGKPRYRLGDNAIFWNTDTWFIHDEGLGATAYFSTDDVAYPWLITTWIASEGPEPLPVVANSSESLTSDEFDAICAYLWNDGNGRAIFP